jgi:hypothetical protein
MRLREKRNAAAESFTAEQANALIDQFATEHEKATLVFSGLAGANVQFGWRLRDLAAVAAGKDLERPLPPFEWNPAAVAEVTARIKLRQELRLPSRECVVRKPPPEADHCLCLSEPIDAVIASGQRTTRDEVLKAARQAHGETWAWLKRKPKPRPVPPAHAPPREAPKPRPAPLPAPAAAVTGTNTRPARVIKRSPKWFDPQPRSVRDMQF